MHEKLQELINYTAEKFHLTDYYLKRHHFFKEKHGLNKIVYILNMEWFPKDAIDVEDDYNPPGTISIDLDFHTKQLKNIIFVNGRNRLEANLPEANHVEAAIEWVEKESGLEFGRQFKLINNDGSRLSFRAAADNIAVFPSGYIQLDFNEEGKLSMFSIHGVFPEEDKIRWEPFNLTSNQTEDMIKQQCTLFEIPVDKEKWLNVYGISEFFISNDGKRIISFEEIEADFSFTPLQTILSWETVEERVFPTEDIDISVETTLEAALENRQPGENQQISEKEQQDIISVVKAYLQSIKPADSGKWKIVSLRREANYLFAELKLAAGETRILNRKINVMLNPSTLQPVNHIDNEALLETFQEFTEAEEAKLSLEEAFKALHQYIEITPVYVYDKNKDTYKLCGKVDCDYAINATTGELITLDELN